MLAVRLERGSDPFCPSPTVWQAEPLDRTYIAPIPSVRDDSQRLSNCRQVEALLREINNSSADNSPGSHPRSQVRQSLTGQPPVGSPLQPRSIPADAPAHPGAAGSLGNNAFSAGGGFSFGGGSMGGASPPRTCSVAPRAAASAKHFGRPCCHATLCAAVKS